jgi:hypothetical protein
MEHVALNSFALSVNWFPVWNWSIWKFLSEFLVAGFLTCTLFWHSGHVRHVIRKGFSIHFDFALWTLYAQSYYCCYKVTTNAQNFWTFGIKG